MKILCQFEDLLGLSKSEIRTLFGGKLLGLYEAHLLGIKVPQTFMIHSQLCKEFLEMHPSKNPREFKEEAARFIEKNLSFDELPEGLYAVRSSAQAEDGSSKSYAGIFDTELNVSKKSISKAIADVWSSLLETKAKAYEKSSQLMGVIIHPMVEAKYAGVCFLVHPSPTTIFENQKIVIEYARSCGEKVVGGEITPDRLIGSFDSLQKNGEHPWVKGLLKNANQLQKSFEHPLDIEFAVDENDQFYLLQQRPISKIYPSNRLDLTPYQRLYKRSLFSLDIELLLEGCCRFLPEYLEIPLDLEQWMIMTTNSQNIQELWENVSLSEKVLHELIENIQQDSTYLSRIHVRYQEHFNKLKGAQPSALHEWFAWTLPLQAHYYAPMFIIDALHTILLKEMQKVDRENAESDLFTLSTSGIASLIDLLNQELAPLKNLTFQECAKKLEDLKDTFGFLKCRQPYEPPYTTKELYEMIESAPSISQKEIDPLSSSQGKKYFKDKRLTQLLLKLREWIQIRNQEMEYLTFAYLNAQPMIEKQCQTLGIDSKTFWQSTKSSLLEKKSIQISSPTIVYLNGETIVSNTIDIEKPSLNSKSCLKGQPVYGSGTLEAEVYVAFSLDEIPEPSKRPAALVTGMTTPDFVPLLRRHFDVLITDEGGILCHAAIIAREIPIPCIVGTGIGSDLLKTGMRVKIELNRGEISYS